MVYRLRQLSAATVDDGARNQLRSRGLRVTPQRLAVLQILEESGEHLDAEALHTRARAHAPDLSLATVYRTLKTLKDAGLVTQRCSGARNTRSSYETTRKEAHHHFRCLGCGKVVEVPDSLLVDALEALTGRLGVAVTSATLEGYCEECREGSGKTPAGYRAMT